MKPLLTSSFSPKKIFSLCLFSKQYLSLCHLPKVNVTFLKFLFELLTSAPSFPAPLHLCCHLSVLSPSSVPSLNPCSVFPQSLAIPSPTFHVLPLVPQTCYNLLIFTKQVQILKESLDVCSILILFFSGFITFLFLLIF